MKNILKTFILTILCLSLVGCSQKAEGKFGQIDEPLEKTLETTFFNVGKGDCMVLFDGEHTVMIDTGFDKSFETFEPYFKEKQIQIIDYLILTHYDKDHIGGADKILENYQVKNLLLPNYQGTGKQYDQLMKALKETGVKPTYVTKNTDFSIGDSEYLIYPPKKDDYVNEDNDFSLGIHLTYGNHRYFFAGDAERERIKELLSLDSIGADIYKVPHHGLREDNSHHLLDKVNPKYAIITCSKEAPADDETLDLLERAKVETYQTQNGTVVITDNGMELSVKQS